MVSGIYYILNKVDGRRYIGQSIDVQLRLNQHKIELNNNSHFNSFLQNSWDKYGADVFEFKLLKACKPQYLNRFEKLYIKKFDTLNRDKGYNLREGGDSNYELSEETLKKMSEQRRGENHHMYGKHHSEETLKKMSEAKKGENNAMYGKHHSEETLKKMSEAHKRSNRHYPSGENHYMYGKHHSEETLKKMSEAKKGTIITESTRKKLSEANKGKIRSKEAKLNVSKARNTTGFFRVDKKKCKQCTQGFYWRYSYLDENNRRKSISSVDINKLREKVLLMGLTWIEY